MNNTCYHILKPSPWPITLALATFIWAIGFIGWNHNIKWGGITTLIGGISITTIFTIWCRDTLRESLYLGMHTVTAKTGAMLGFYIFMISETFFFATFILVYFYTALNPTVHIGTIWPPLGIQIINPWSIPLLNTIILLTSGATVTWSHNSLLAKARKPAILGLLFTIVLGGLFSIFQLIEYWESSITLSDSVYGAVFFSTLSLHAIHIWIGVIWLIACGIRLWQYKISSKHHLIMEGALLFWHIVDAIWIILFIFYYVWVW